MSEKAENALVEAARLKQEELRAIDAQEAAVEGGKAMSMTDEQVVRVLAEREGWKYSSIPADGGCYGWVSPRGGFPQEVTALPNYLTSRDALQPVIEKLTARERSCLELNTLRFVYDNAARAGQPACFAILRLSPRTLSHAIAEAIEGVAGATTTNEKGSE